MDPDKVNPTGVPPVAGTSSGSVPGTTVGQEPSGMPVAKPMGAGGMDPVMGVATPAATQSATAAGFAPSTPVVNSVDEPVAEMPTVTGPTIGTIPPMDAAPSSAEDPAVSVEEPLGEPLVTGAEEKSDTDLGGSSNTAF